MGWVGLFLLLPLGPALPSASPQLWEWGRVEGSDGGWEPDRRPKSLGFLGSKEEAEVEEVVNNSVDAEKPNKVSKKAKLNVSDKDSPYALIDKYFPERESYFYQNKNKFVEEYRSQETKTDIGNIHPSEVWLADDNLLVLKGGSTPDRAGWDDPWEPLDDFQAPYREPVLPPPDFDPDSLEIGVGVDIETLLRQRALEQEFKPSFDELREQFSNQKIPDQPQFVDPQNFLLPYKEEVFQTHQEEFNNFFNDVSQFISDMENFHSARKANSQQVDEPTFKEMHPLPFTETEALTSFPRDPSFNTAQLSRGNPPVKLIRDVPFTSFPTPSPVPKEEPTASILREVHPESSIEVLPKSFREPSPKRLPSTPRPSPKEDITPAWQRVPITERRFVSQEQKSVRKQSFELSMSNHTTPYPLSYSSPHSKVYLSTNFVTHPPPSKTPSPSPKRTHKNHSTKRPAPFPSQIPNRSFTFQPAGTLPTSPTNPVRIFRPRSTTLPPSLTTPATMRTTSQSSLSRPQVGSVYRNEYRDSGEQEDWRPVPNPPTPPSRSHPSPFNPAPTPYSLFQSVPENIGETDVFHLSQNVDFGKKIESGAGLLTNEVDTGVLHPVPPFSPAKLFPSRAPRKTNKARQIKRGGFLPSFGAPLPPPVARPPPSRGSRRGRGRNTVRRRRPKAVLQSPVDRTGTGDVRYVSFYSGGIGGHAWGYSYNLG